MEDIEANVDGMVHKQKRVLLIISVRNEDYGNYECEASNSEGTEKADITLLKTSVPDSPSALELSAIEWHMASLTWSPGFDGGKKQAFKIVYKMSAEWITAESSESMYNLTGTVYYALFSLKFIQHRNFQRYQLKCTRRASVYQEICESLILINLQLFHSGLEPLDSLRT